MYIYLHVDTGRQEIQDDWSASEWLDEKSEGRAGSKNVRYLRGPGNQPLVRVRIRRSVVSNLTIPGTEEVVKGVQAIILRPSYARCQWDSTQASASVGLSADIHSSVQH